MKKKSILFLLLATPILVFSQTTQTVQTSAPYGGVTYDSFTNVYGTQTKNGILVGKSLGGSTTCGRGYLEFDLTNVSLTNLSSAKLILYGSGASHSTQSLQIKQLSSQSNFSNLSSLYYDLLNTGTSVGTANFTGSSPNTVVTIDKSKLSQATMIFSLSNANEGSHSITVNVDLELTFTQLLPPLAPTNLTINNTLTPTSCTLSWTASSGATGYKVYNNNLIFKDVSTSTNTSTSLTLIPGTAYSFTVSAVNAAGESPKSTALTLSAPYPTPVISGYATICSGSSKSFSSTNWQNGVFTWTCSSNLSLSTSSATPTTVSTIGIGSAWVRVMQGSTQLAEYQLWTGVPPSPVNTVSGEKYPCLYTNYTYSINTSSMPAGTTYSWSIFPGTDGVDWSITKFPTSADVMFGTAGYYSVIVTASNDCGTCTSPFPYAVAATQCRGGISVYPNPVSDILYIDIDPQQSQVQANRQQLTYDIRLYDQQGNLALNHKTAQTGTVQIDVSSLRNGTYMLQIFDGVDTQPYATIVIKN